MGDRVEDSSSRKAQATPGPNTLERSHEDWERDSRQERARYLEKCELTEVQRLVRDWCEPGQCPSSH